MHIGGVLSQRALVGLQQYRYKAGGYTFLDDLHQPAWNYLVEQLPSWLAPNLITLIGSLGILLAYVFNTYFNAGFVGEEPAWVHLFTAISIFVYVNLDSMDGKQARRTKSSSPLGQLFDHGCDAIVLHMMLANIAACMGIGCGWKMAAGCYWVMVPWVLAQWEEYHTGIMIYGTKYYGVLEANYCICLVHLGSALCGLPLWQRPLHLPHALQPAAAALLRPFLPAAAAAPLSLSMTLADGVLWGVSLAGLVQAVHNIGRVLVLTPMLPKEEHGCKHLGRGPALLHLLILMGSTLLGAVAVAQAGNSDVDADRAWRSLQSDWSPSLLPEGHSPSTAYCRLSFSMFGVLYALVATQLILAHMAKEPLYPSMLAFGCLGAAIVNGVLGIMSPSLLVLLLCTVAMVGYAYYVVGSIKQICDHLEISCLTIKQKHQA